MEKQRFGTTDQMMIGQAARSGFLESPKVNAALHYVRDRPEILKIRRLEFDAVIYRLNKEMQKKDLSPTRFGNVIELKRLLGGRSLSDIDKYTSMVLGHATFEDDQEISFDPKKTFDHIGQLLQSGEWDWVKGYPAEKMTSALLITGYGEMLEIALNIPGLKKSFFLAFEEVLIEMESSNLLRDVLPAMEEEIPDFSPEVQDRILFAVGVNKAQEVLRKIHYDRLYSPSAAMLGFSPDRTCQYSVDSGSIIIRTSETPSDLEAFADEIQEIIQSHRDVVASDVYTNTQVDRSVDAVMVSILLPERQPLLDVFSGHEWFLGPEVRNVEMDQTPSTQINLVCMRIRE